MSELIFRAVDNVHTDPAKDKVGSYKKGYPVDVLDDGVDPGKEVIPPNFIRISCPELSTAAARTYFQMWARRISYSIVAHNVALDGYRVRVKNDTNSFNVSGLGKLSRADIETLLTNWNVTVFSIADNEVILDVSIYNTIISGGFVRRNRTGIVFSEVNYVKATGEHRVEIDFSATAHTVDAIEGALTDRGGTFIITDVPTKKTQVTFGRDDVFQALKRDIEFKANRVECLRRFYISAADVDFVLAKGGHITLTKAQLLSKFIDKLSE